MPESIFDIIGSARSMRWFKEDPVDHELIEKLVWAATRASNPNNTQHWNFVVVTSPELKQRLKAAITATAISAPIHPPGTVLPVPDDPVSRRTIDGARNLLSTLDKVPVLIFICSANAYPETNPRVEMAYSAIFASAQNLLVAARALGLGAAFTTFHQRAESQIREILRIPADQLIGVTIPIGWPARQFGPVTRRPIADVIHIDYWH